MRGREGRLLVRVKFVRAEQYVVTNDVDYYVSSYCKLENIGLLREVLSVYLVE